jgi:hypothetical protein
MTILNQHFPQLAYQAWCQLSLARMNRLISKVPTQGPIPSQAISETLTRKIGKTWTDLARTADKPCEREEIDFEPPTDIPMCPCRGHSASKYLLDACLKNGLWNADENMDRGGVLSVDIDVKCGIVVNQASMGLDSKRMMTVISSRIYWMLYYFSSV